MDKQLLARADRASENLLQLFLETIRQAVDNSTQTAVAQKLGVNGTAVGRWYHGERGGQRLTLNSAIRGLIVLGVPMEEMIAALSGEKEKSKAIVSLLSQHPDLVDALSQIAERGDDQALNQIKNLSEYISSK